MGWLLSPWSPLRLWPLDCQQAVLSIKMWILPTLSSSNSRWSQTSTSCCRARECLRARSLKRPRKHCSQWCPARVAVNPRAEAARRAASRAVAIGTNLVVPMKVPSEMRARSDLAPRKTARNPARNPALRVGKRVHPSQADLRRRRAIWR